MKTVYNLPVPVIEGKPLTIADVEYNKYPEFEFEKVRILTGMVTIIFLMSGN